MIAFSNTSVKRQFMSAKFSKIKDYICHQIESGSWQPNEKVPSENELAEKFSVSRMTARRALQELAEQGLLLRTKGLGTFVATFKSQSSLLEIKNIADEIRDRGHKHTSLQLALSTQTISEELAILLNLKPGEKVGYAELLHMENDQAIQLEQRYVNFSLAPGYLSQDFTKATPHEYLSSVAPLTEATHEVEATLPSTETAKHLAVSLSQPCLQVKRRTWSKQGVVSFAILTSPGDKYRLGGHLFFN